MKRIIIAVFMLGLIPSSAYGATPVPGNLLISSGSNIYEYTTSGSRVQTIPIEFPGGYPQTEYARDLAANTSGKIFVYNGTFNPYMSTYDSISSTWSHLTFDGFSTVNNGTYGGIDFFGDTVFVSDMFTYSGGEAKGIIAFNTLTGQAQRFATNIEPIDLTVGLDGLLYALSPGGSPEGLIIDVYNPSTLAYIRSIDLNGIFGWTGHRSIAADYNGDIFIADWDGELSRISKTGSLISKIWFGISFKFFDIDISQDSQLALSDDDGIIIITDISFSITSSFNAGFFVEFIPKVTEVTPQVILINPANNETDAAVDTTISAAFSEAIDTATVGDTTFYLNEEGSTTTVAATITADSSATTFYLKPNAPLNYDTTYTATLTTGITDLAGNPLASDYTFSFKTRALNLYEESLAANEGAWIDTPHPMALGGSLKLSPIPGGKATYTFTGNQVDIISTVGPTMGSIDIYIDGSYTGKVSLNNADYLFQQTIASYSGFGMGDHTLEIVSAGGLIVLDAIKAESLSAYPTHYGESAVAYTSNWINALHSLFTDGNSKMSPGVLGDTATFNFIGSEVRIIGLTGPIFGIADIKIDGTLYSTVDLYQPSFTIQSTIESITGLSPGFHTLEVVASGNQNPLSAASLINIDGFDVW